LDNICKENIIKFYIGQLTKYIKQKNIFEDNLKNINSLVLDKISKYIEQDNFELYFSHNDIQKYNIIIQSNNKIKLIDWEYSGYTWKYFDHINFIVLVLNEKITGKVNIIENDVLHLHNHLEKYKQIFFSLYSNVSLEYFNSIFLISAYTWYLWSVVKYHMYQIPMYLEYSKQMEFIISLIK
jgi:thiamine kinase-like enzyme